MKNVYRFLLSPSLEEHDQRKIEIRDRESIFDSRDQKKKKKCSEKLKLSIINTKLVDYNRFKENIHNKEVLREEKGWGKGRGLVQCFGNNVFVASKLYS